MAINAALPLKATHYIMLYTEYSVQHHKNPRRRSVRKNHDRWNVVRQRTLLKPSLTSLLVTGYRSVPFKCYWSVPVYNTDAAAAVAVSMTGSVLLSELVFSVKLQLPNPQLRLILVYKAHLI